MGKGARKRFKDKQKNRNKNRDDQNPAPVVSSNYYFPLFRCTFGYCLIDIYLHDIGLLSLKIIVGF